MQKLHLVGFTTDHEGLILSARRGSRSGSYVLVIGPSLEEAVDELRARRAASATEVDDPAVERAPRVESALSVKEIQARLRTGRSVDEVAKAAGVDEAWVERFAAPVLAERIQVINRVQAAPLHRARLGPSRLPIGDAVLHHLADRGLALTAHEFADAWSAQQISDGRWTVRFAYRYRGRNHTLRYHLDETTGEVTTSDRTSAAFGYVAPDADPRARPATPRATGRPVVSTSFRPEVARAGAPSRSAKERERAAAAMRRAAAQRAAEAERAAARRVKERRAEAAKRERAERADEARAERDAEAAKARADREAAAARARAEREAAKQAAAAKRAPAKKGAAAKTGGARKRAAARTTAAARKPSAARSAPAKKRATTAGKAAGAGKAAAAKRAPVKKRATAASKAAAARSAPAEKRAAARTAAAASKAAAVRSAPAKKGAAARRPAAAGKAAAGKRAPAEKRATAATQTAAARTSAVAKRAPVRKSAAARKRARAEKGAVTATAATPRGPEVKKRPAAKAAETSTASVSRTRRGVANRAAPDPEPAPAALADVVLGRFEGRSALETARERSAPAPGSPSDVATGRTGLTEQPRPAPSSVPPVPAAPAPPAPTTDDLPWLRPPPARPNSAGVSSSRHRGLVPLEDVTPAPRPRFRTGLVEPADRPPATAAPSSNGEEPDAPRPPLSRPRRTRPLRAT